MGPSTAETFWVSVSVSKAWMHWPFIAHAPFFHLFKSIENHVFSIVVVANSHAYIPMDPTAKSVTSSYHIPNVPYSMHSQVLCLARVDLAVLERPGVICFTLCLAFLPLHTLPLQTSNHPR